MTLKCPLCETPYVYLHHCTDRCETCDRCFLCCICPDDRTPEQKAMSERARRKALIEAGVPLDAIRGSV